MQLNSINPLRNNSQLKLVKSGGECERGINPLRNNSQLKQEQSRSCAEITH